MHFPKMPEGLSHKLAIGAAIIFVLGGTYLYINANGDEDLGISPGTLNTGLGGFGDIFRKMLGGLKDASGIAPSNPNLILPPSGQIGTEIGTDINSQGPTSEGATTNYVEQFKQSLIDFFTPPSSQGTSAEAAPLENYTYQLSSPTAQVNEEGRPTIGSADPHYELTQYALASPDNPGGITQQDIANLGNYEGSVAQLMATTGYETGSPPTT